MRVERGKFALLIQHTLVRHEATDAISVVLHVVFAGPHELDRRVGHLGGDIGCIGHEVVEQAATKATTDAHLMQRDLVSLETGDTGHQRQAVGRQLCRSPQLDRIALEPGDGVLRLQLRMRHESELVVALDRLGRGQHLVDIADSLDDLVTGGLNRQFLGLDDVVAPAVLRRSAVIPIDLELLAR